MKYFLELNGIPDRISYINTLIENIDKTIHNMTEVYLAFTTKLSFFFECSLLWFVFIFKVNGIPGPAGPPGPPGPTGINHSAFSQSCN